MKTFLQYPSVWQTKAASFWTLTEPVSLYRVDIFHFLSLQDPFSLLFKFFQNRKDNASGKEGSILYQWQEVASIIRRKKTYSDAPTSRRHDAFEWRRCDVRRASRADCRNTHQAGSRNIGRAPSLNLALQSRRLQQMFASDDDQHFCREFLQNLAQLV